MDLFISLFILGEKIVKKRFTSDTNFPWSSKVTAIKRAAVKDHLIGNHRLLLALPSPENT